MAEEPTKLDISDEMIAERRSGLGKMPDDMPKWIASLITKIDLFSKWVGNVVCWITIPLILGMVYEVFARKLFLAPTIWAYDMSRFLYGALFMLGAGPLPSMLVFEMGELRRVILCYLKALEVDLVGGVYLQSFNRHDSSTV